MAPAARQGDAVLGTDIHIVLVPTPGGPVATPTPFPFSAKITEGCSTNVLIGGQQAAIVGSTTENEPSHVPASGTFSVPPTNRGTVMSGSPTVLINGKPAARAGDQVMTCNDPAPAPTGVIEAVNTVIIGP